MQVQDICPSGVTITPTRTRSTWWVPALGCIVMVGLLALGGALDQWDSQRETQRETERETERQQAFDAGREQGQAEMVATAEAAWQAAQVEADRCAMKGSRP